MILMLLILFFKSTWCHPFSIELFIDLIHLTCLSFVLSMNATEVSHPSSTTSSFPTEILVSSTALAVCANARYFLHYCRRQQPAPNVVSCQVSQLETRGCRTSFRHFNDKLRINSYVGRNSPTSR